MSNKLICSFGNVHLDMDSPFDNKWNTLIDDVINNCDVIKKNLVAKYPWFKCDSTVLQIYLIDIS